MIIMTKKNILSLLTAGIMGISCFSMNVFAESAYAVGDIDMDGIVTGHDTAMVSRYLLDESYTLTEEQLILADVDGDGEVTQADADKLYNEMQEYELGNVDALFEDDRKIDDSLKLRFTDLSDGRAMMMYYAYHAIELDYNFTEVQKNLADLDLNGVVNTKDVLYAMSIYAFRSVGFDCVFPKTGIYYYSSDPNSPAYYLMPVPENWKG